jgi:hypothetical protein
MRPTYQEILRSVGAWLDMRGYQEIRIIQNPEGLAIEGLSSAACADAEPERLLLTNEQIERFCDASRLNRDAPPPLSPEPSHFHLTLVPMGDD